MNRKQLLLLLVVVVLVGGAGLWLYQRNKTSWQSANENIGQKLLGDLPVNDIARIDLKQATNEVNLVKKNDTDLWRVRERNDYPANYSEISSFLVKLHDLKAVQNEKVGPSHLARLGLVPGETTNAALVVDFKDQKDKPIKSLLLGKKHMRKSDRPSPFGDMGGDEGWPDGRYVKIGNNSATVALISDALSNIEPKPEQWLNKDFFKVEKPKSIAVTFPNPTNSWKLTRETETGEWKLADAKLAEQLDSGKVSGVSSPFTSPSFNDVATGGKPEELLDKPTVVNIDTFDHFNYTVKVGQKTNDNYPLNLTVTAQLAKERTPGKDEKPEDKTKLDKEFQDKQKKLEEKLSQEKNYEKWIYLVSSWTVDSLLKDRSQLLVEKKEEPKKEETKKEEPKPEEKPVIGELPKPSEQPAKPAEPKPEAK